MRFWLFLCASVFLLSACGSDDADKHVAEKAEEKPAKHKTVEAPPPICPHVAIVGNLDLLRDYGGEAPAANQLVSAAKLVGIDGDCEYRDDGIDVAFQLKVAAKRGPRLGGTHVSFPYFVAVLDPSDTILNKDQMTAEFHFASDETVTNHTEPLHIFIPLAKDKQTEGPSYRVLIGFQRPGDPPAPQAAKPDTGKAAGKR